jgi:hypothetical protein
LLLLLLLLLLFLDCTSPLLCTVQLTTKDVLPFWWNWFVGARHERVYRRFLAFVEGGERV